MHFSDLFHRGVLVLFFHQTGKVSYNVCTFQSCSTEVNLFCLFFIKKERSHIMYAFFRVVPPKCNCFVVQSKKGVSYDVAHIMHIFQSCSTEVHLENGKNMYTLGCTPNHVSLLESSFTLRPCNR